MSSGLLKKVGKNEVHKIISLDRYCRLAIIETEFLTERNISDHLSNQDAYKRLSRREALGRVEGVERLIELFIGKYNEMLSKEEYTYLKRGLAQDRGTMLHFYTTSKVHKKVKEKQLVQSGQ